MKKLKVGIVGLGRISGSHISEISSFPEKFEIVAVADNDPSRLTNLRDEIKNATCYNSIEELLKDDSIDMVTICTRHKEHVPMALQILDAGKIAVVEKPIATSVAELNTLLEAGKKHPNKLFFRHNRRFEAAFIKAKDLMNSGIIGEVQYIKIYRSVGFCRRNDWMTMTEFYGGLLSNWGPHLIDQALQFLDSPVKSMWSDVRRVVSIGDGDDLFKILLRAENGRVADIEVTGANTMPGREMEIIGSRGTIVYTGSGPINVRHIDPSVELKDLKPHPENPPLQYGNFDETLYFVDSNYDIPKINMSVLWTHLYETVTNNTPFPITFEQVSNVVKVTEDAFKQNGLYTQQ